MLKVQSKVIDILCDLELIYPPALFDIMIHLLIHLPLEALKGGPIRPWWMYPCERYMKKLKGYVRNKAKPEGSIAEGYVAEEAFTFSSHYFRDVTTKFNRSDRNFDPPLPTCQFQVFRLIRQRHVDNDKDPEVSTTSELFALACGPTWTPISINSCVVDGVRYVVHSRDERRITQNSDICSPGPDEEMYYGQLQEILGFKYLLFKMSSDVARSHGGDSGGEDHPPPHHVPSGCMGCFANRDKGKRKPNLGGRTAGRLNTRDKTQNLSLKNITNTKGPVPIQFELRDKQTVMPLGDHAAHWSSYIGEVIRGVPLYYPSWLKVPKERNAALITNIGVSYPFMFISLSCSFI
nr:hypothetical protein [Tanacetum cinerariifolium]